MYWSQKCLHRRTEWIIKTLRFVQLSVLSTSKGVATKDISLPKSVEKISYWVFCNYSTCRGKLLHLRKSEYNLRAPNLTPSFLYRPQLFRAYYLVLYCSRTERKKVVWNAVADVHNERGFGLYIILNAKLVAIEMGEKGVL